MNLTICFSFLLLGVSAFRRISFRKCRLRGMRNEAWVNRPIIDSSSWILHTRRSMILARSASHARYLSSGKATINRRVWISQPRTTCLSELLPSASSLSGPSRGRLGTGSTSSPACGLTNECSSQRNITYRRWSSGTPCPSRLPTPDHSS